jgi:hypothetical protein
MATWDKDYILLTLRDSSTGALDTTTRTVVCQPTDQAYPTGAVTCEQLASLCTYKPLSDLDAETHYWVYVDGTKKFKLTALNSEPNIGV